MRGLLLLALSGLLAWPAQAQSALPAAVQEALAAAQIPQSSLSALVLPLDSQTPTLTHQADRAMAPGSALKLLTTAVALDELGPTFRWHTQLLSLRQPVGEQLRGPLYLRGDGDPDLSWSDLQRMLRELRTLGIRDLRGDLVLDRSAFNPARPDVGAAAFDETPNAYYNVIPDALLLGSNLLELQLHSDQRGVQARLRTPLQGVQLQSLQTLDDSACADWDDDALVAQARYERTGLVRLSLSGSFPRNCTANTKVNVLDRNTFIEHSLRKLWSELGGRWQGHVRDGLTPADAHLWVDHPSATLADVVKRINKRSDNAMARSLYLTLGAQSSNRSAHGNDFEAAAQRVRDWLTRRAIDAQGLVLENGSGLSRSERISAQQLALTLQAAARSAWFAELDTSLPIVGLDGTMGKRLRDTAAAQRSRIKTGTLRDVVAVAGYVQDTNGRRWVVVGMVNHPVGKAGRPALDALVDWVARARVSPGTGL